MEDGFLRAEKKIDFWKQYEFRVIIIMICVIATTAILLYRLIFFQFNKVILDDIKSEAYRIHEYLDEFMDEESFEDINTIEDESKEGYMQLREQLVQVQKITNIKNIFTAKRNESGEYIYMIDGMDKEAEVFMHAGSLIEEEIIPILEQSLAGSPVLGDDITDTEWGIAYVAFFPVNNGAGKVIGAIGMEFDVEDVYHSLYKTRTLSILLCIVIAAVFLFISIILLKRVTGPIYKKLACTDLMTTMMNRSAFDLAMEDVASNLKSENKISIIIYDLNNLKMINDIMGHAMGDAFIKKASGILLDVYGETGTCFRIGGDEFAVLTVGKTRRAVLEMVRKAKDESRNKLMIDSKEFTGITVGMACGFAMFDGLKDKGIYETFNRADDNMYKMKRWMKNR